MDTATLLYALQLVPGFGNITIRQLLNNLQSIEAIFDANPDTLALVPGIGPKLAANAGSFQSYIPEATEVMLATARSGGQAVTILDDAYPKRLKEIPDAPPVLFVKGNTDLNNKRIISMVGTRDATDYGKRVVEDIIEGIRSYRPLVVSGLAYGIDIHAHKMALKYDVETVGVMGSGIDIIYPAVHRKIAGKMVESGGLVSEYPPGTDPDAPHFPMRNRLIAGMSDAVIVVEAAAKGGALITAELANGYDRDVMAVPGTVHTTTSEGCNKLIRNHKAHILTSPDDVAYLLNWPKPAGTPARDRKDLSQEQKQLLELIESHLEGLHIDELTGSTGWDPSLMASMLLELEFDDWIVSIPGNRYRIR